MYSVTVTGGIVQYSHDKVVLQLLQYSQYLAGAEDGVHSCSRHLFQVGQAEGVPGGEGVEDGGEKTSDSSIYAGYFHLLAMPATMASEALKTFWIVGTLQKKEMNNILV